MLLKTGIAYGVADDADSAVDGTKSDTAGTAEQTKPAVKKKRKRKAPAVTPVADASAQEPPEDATSDSAPQLAIHSGGQDDVNENEGKDTAAVNTEEASGSSEAEEVEDLNAPMPDIGEDLYWAEVRLAGSIAKVERIRADLEDEIAQANVAVASAQAELSRQEAEKHSLVEQLKVQTEFLHGLVRKLLKVSTGKELPTEDEVAEAKVEDGWRAARTAEILQGIKGLSVKKLTTLADEAPCIGDIEDLRASASKQHKAFHQVLPRGIGEGVASLIEDRIAEHIAEWTRRSKDPERAKFADDLVAELRELSAEWEEADCTPRESDDEHLHAGFSAFGEGRPHTEFLSDDRSKSRLWMTGWVGAERLKQIAG